MDNLNKGVKGPSALIQRYRTGSDFGIESDDGDSEEEDQVVQ